MVIGKAQLPFVGKKSRKEQTMQSCNFGVSVLTRLTFRALVYSVGEASCLCVASRKSGILDVAVVLVDD